MKQYEPYKITLQWGGETCKSCECSLFRGDTVWAQAHPFNRRSFWCLKDGNFMFEGKSDITISKPEEQPKEVNPKPDTKKKKSKGFIEKVKAIVDEKTDDSDDLKSISSNQWPSINSIEYAIENIHDHANREELKKYKMESKKGLLYQFQGAFAVIYKGINDKKHEYALRLFTARNFMAMDRYNKLSTYFEKNKIYERCTYFTEFKYLPRAIEIYINTVDTEAKRTENFPILRMGWVTGKSFEDFIKETTSTDEIKKLTKNFLHMINKLEELKISHGDLHPKNILVDGELNLRLVDYDCIYISDFKGNSQPEGGDADCQHPHRKKFTYDEKLDRFSALVIYLGLLAISENIDLKSHKNSGEFPFSQTDFVDPSSSELFSKLEILSPSVRFLTKKLAHYCKSDIPEISSLNELLYEFEHNEGEENGRSKI
tara:strand:- start:1744 stop:3030 length:1287 start_codon:yes stop_codon:yes gene_type:complete